jgi:hypothetical protein
MVELEPQYKLRILEPKLYATLGALASINLQATDQTWIKIYEERKKELEGEIDVIRDNPFQAT